MFQYEWMFRAPNGAFSPSIGEINPEIEMGLHPDAEGEAVASPSHGKSRLLALAGAIGLIGILSQFTWPADLM